jgi:hypothetical protein
VYVVASAKDEQSELAVRMCGAPVPSRSIKHPFGLQPSVGSPMVDAIFSASSRTSFIVMTDLSVRFVGGLRKIWH